MKEKIKIWLALLIFPLYAMSVIFMVSAFNCWELWRGVVSFGFLLLAAINFMLVLLLGN